MAASRSANRFKSPSFPSLWELLPGRIAPWLWALTEDAKASQVLPLIAELLTPASNGQSVAPEIESALGAWLEASPDAGNTATTALEAITWCHALPTVAEAVSQQLGARLWQKLLAIADEKGPSLESDPLSNQLQAGELPLTLAYLFPEKRHSRGLATRACDALTEGLQQLLDGEGLLHGSHWPMLRPLLACWTRSRAMGNCVPNGCWSEEAEAQFEWLVRQAVRFTRADGEQVLAQGPQRAWCAELFQAAMRLGGDHHDSRIATLALPKLPTRSGRRKAMSQNGRGLPSASLHSEWAAMTMLRAGWNRGDSCLAVAYPGTTVSAEFSCARSVLWSGPWPLDLAVDGQRAAPCSDWEEVCWVSDKDCDYLELQATFTGGLTVQRQLLLAKQDQFLLLADVVLGREPAKLEYRASVPLCPDVAAQWSEENREGWLTSGGRRRALILPLALPEWRSDPRFGEFHENKRTLELRLVGQGRSLFAPLFVDFKPGRFGKPFTWRQLTVGQNLQAQPADVAVGYRVMIDRQQWLIYRALASKGNRTLLGHNLATEMLVARFRRDGEVEKIVEIE